MAKPFRSLREKMSPEAQVAAEQKMQAMLATLSLQELQQTRHRAQEHLATIGQGTPAERAAVRLHDYANGAVQAPGCTRIVTGALSYAESTQQESDLICGPPAK